MMLNQDLMLNLQESNLKELEETDIALRKQRKDFLEKYPSSFWRIEVGPFIYGLKQGISKKETEVKRKISAMRQNGISFAEREKYRKDNERRAVLFKEKYFKPVKDVETWLVPKDIEWVERNGVESFIRNFLEVIL